MKTKSETRPKKFWLVTYTTSDVGDDERTLNNHEWSTVR